MKKWWVGILLMLILVMLPVVAVAETGEYGGVTSPEDSVGENDSISLSDGSESEDDGITTLNGSDKKVYKELKVTEIFIDQFKQYEQMMKNNLVFYTNVANGSFTQEPVVIEVPANMTATLTRGGADVPFTAGVPIQTPGAYVLTVYADNKASLELGDNEIYFSTFRFKVVKEDEANKKPDTELPTTGGELEDTEKDSAASIPEDMLEEDAGLEDYLPTDDELNALEVPTLNADSQTPAAGAENGKAPASTSAMGSVALISQQYDTKKSVFTCKTAAGDSFTANIPNGFITSRPVRLTFTEALPVEAYLDDQPYEYILNTELSEPGNYRLILGKKTGSVSPMFTFTILPAKTKGLSVYNAPADFSITKVMLDGQPQTAQASQLFLEQDGRYELTVTGNGFAIPVAFELDDSPPLVRLQGMAGTSGKGPVAVEILSEDTKEIIVTQDGQPIASETLTFEQAGSYRVAVTDNAGNSTILGFTILSSINGMGVVAILCFAGLIIAGIVYVIIIRRRLVVR